MVGQDIIISGGENISSLEVESIMMKHEKIAEVAVVARPSSAVKTSSFHAYWTTMSL